MKKLIGLALVLFVSTSAFASKSDNMNFRFSPIGLIVGAFSLNLDYAVTPNFTVGPEASYWKFSLKSDSTYYSSDYKIVAWGLGVRGNWFANGVYTDGFYVGPSLSYQSVELNTTDTSGVDVKGTLSAPFLSCLFGYGWFWDSFNMMLGGGFSTGLGDNKVVITDSTGYRREVTTSLSGLALEYSLGWTF